MEKRPPRPHPGPRTPDPGATGWFHWSYLLDWGLTLGVAGGVLALRFGSVDPREKAFSVDDPAISYPLRNETVPSWQLTFFAVTPLVAIGLSQIASRSWHDVHHATLGLSESLVLTMFATLALKKSIGSLRPDFLARCQTDPEGRCTGDEGAIAAGRESFPSGHTSFAFAGGAYLALYLWGKLRPFRTDGALWKVLVILSPVVAASLVGVSRVLDHRHRAEDVVMGAVLGTGFAVLGYHLHYPAPWSKTAGRPKVRAPLVAAPLVGRQTYGLVITGMF